MAWLARDVAAVLSREISKLVGREIEVCTSLDFDFDFTKYEWHVAWKCCACGAEVHDVTIVSHALATDAAYEPPELATVADATAIARNMQRADDARRLIADHISRAVESRAYHCKEIHE